MNTEGEENPISIEISADNTARNVFIFCLAFEIFLVLIDLVVNYYEIIDIKAIHSLCNIAREDSLA